MGEISILIALILLYVEHQLGKMMETMFPFQD